MIDDHLIPNSASIINQWQPFRKHFLWNLEINEIYKLNALTIADLLKVKLESKETHLSQKHAMALFTKDTELISEKEAQYCFAMSKMTLIQETRDHKKQKQIGSITELYEMIARVAQSKYKDERPLSEKILDVFTKLFALIGAKVVRPKVVVDEDISASDSDY
jgi:hypothetical protein